MGPSKKLSHPPRKDTSRWPRLSCPTLPAYFRSSLGDVSADLISHLPQPLGNALLSTDADAVVGA
ncbi:hypothetical protein ART_3641 [Arthrobacter sp. PAMC 25486]|nr:hypothetical protein ART_3641 [Arthrobacter sp. PAMC 25486]